MTEYDHNIPIYLQIVESIKLKILIGEWKSGERIPSVRDLAAVHSVNPNTMQKALTELEREGILYAERTSGRYVTEDKDLLIQARDEMAKGTCFIFIKRMKELGFTVEETMHFVELLWNDKQ